MKLGDIIFIKHGYAFKGENIINEDNNIVLVTPGNFKIGGGFQEDKCKFFNGDIPEEYILSGGDIIVTMTDLSKDIDTLGYSAMIPKSFNRIYLHNQRIGLLTFKNKSVIPKYIYYLMQTYEYQRAIANTSSGATVHHTSPSKIYDYDISLPSEGVQLKIANILSAYDELIENNQKQIKLLEEAAQRLYKEWFVDLRFPGHEQTKIIDGVPEGWEKVCLKAYCDIKSGYAFKSKDWNKSGCGVIKIKDISNKFVDYSDCDFVPKDIAEKAANYYLNQGDLVIAMTGATIGKIGICTKEGYYANQRVGKVFLGNKPKEKLPYAYCILSQKSTMDFILNNSSASSAQPNISGDKICDIKIVYNEVYVMRFNKKMKSVFEKMILLKEQNEMLSVIRDNLLPKLMSGEIEV